MPMFAPAAKPTLSSQRTVIADGNARSIASIESSLDAESTATSCHGGSTTAASVEQNSSTNSALL